MNFLTLSSFAIVILLGALWGFLKVLPAETPISGNRTKSPEDQLILGDVPPPDDTYTPDQRRHS